MNCLSGLTFSEESQWRLQLEFTFLPIDCLFFEGLSLCKHFQLLFNIKWNQTHAHTHTHMHWPFPCDQWASETLNQCLLAHWWWTVNLRGGNAASGSFAARMNDLLHAGLLLSKAGQDWSSRRPSLAATASNRAACRSKVSYESRSRITSPGKRNLFTPHYGPLRKCAKSVSVGSFPPDTDSAAVKHS